MDRVKRIARGSGVRVAGVVLVVEDDSRAAQTITERVPDEYRPVVVGSVAEVEGVLATGLQPVAAVVDTMLPDGDGLEVVRSLRACGSGAPVLLVTGLLSRSLVNGAHELGAELVCKPDYGVNLRVFFDRVDGGFERQPDEARIFGEVADELSLSPRERDLIRLAFNGVPRGRLAEVMGISENTVKKLVRSLLEKTHQSSLSEALWQVLLRVERRCA
jgi:DNA-binding NarL/FixJ family response regulator